MTHTRALPTAATSHARDGACRMTHQRSDIPRNDRNIVVRPPGVTSAPEGACCGIAAHTFHHEYVPALEATCNTIADRVGLKQHRHVFVMERMSSEAVAAPSCGRC